MKPAAASGSGIIRALGRRGLCVVRYAGMRKGEKPAMGATQVKGNKARPIGVVATVVGIVLLSMVCAYAQETVEPQEGPAADVDLASTKFSGIVRWRYTTPVRIRERPRSQTGSRICLSLNTVGFGIPLDTRGLGANSQQPPQAGRKRSVRRKVLGGIVGGVGGFFGGMFLGAAIEGDRCDCDDPGLVGALTGAPVGGVAGGILGYKFLF
jgi:hypothetical protein